MPLSDCWECKHLEKRRGGDQYCLLYGRPLYVDANKARCDDYKKEAQPTSEEIYSAGQFKDKEECIVAVQELREKLYGEFTRH